jgi:hypothetical protein
MLSTREQGLFDCEMAISMQCDPIAGPPLNNAILLIIENSLFGFELRRRVERSLFNQGDFSWLPAISRG